MSDTSTPRKRSVEETKYEDLPVFEDPADLVNAVISVLQVPEEKTNVAIQYANDRNSATEVQAYAKIAGQDWTFYVKSLSISLGRNTDNAGGDSHEIDIDLGPAKVVSRQHAIILYNLDFRYWELKVLGRNGARVDGQKVPYGENSSTPLHSGAILDVGGTQMMFILPDSTPSIHPQMLSTCLSRYKANMRGSKRRLSNYSQQNFSVLRPQTPNNYGQVKSFQLFDKAQLAHSPSSVSASSLQNNLDQDLSKEESKDIKPPYSYATMITQAILSNEDGVMSLSEIYDWIASHYAYYKYSKTGWQNSIRHNLSLNKAFEKVPRRPNEPGKGMKWQISESYKEDFLNRIQSGSLLKTRRGSSVTRQLQLYLATHQNLPEPQKYYVKEDRLRSNTADGSDDQQVLKNSGPRFGQWPQFYGYAGQLQGNTQGIRVNNQGQTEHGQIPQRPYGIDPAPFFYGPGSNQMMPQNLASSQQFQTHKNGFISPMKQPGDFKGSSFSRMSGNHVFNLPPPLPSSQHLGVSGAHASHSRQNSYGQQLLFPEYHNSSFANPSTQPTTSESTSGNPSASSSLPTTNASDLLGFTSPKKISPIEAFTPERGSKASNNNNKASATSGLNTSQSSPAFWNFVQFSTPNTQTPIGKLNELNQLSPTLARKFYSENGNLSERIDDGKMPSLKASMDKNIKPDSEDLNNKNREINA